MTTYPFFRLASNSSSSDRRDWRSWGESFCCLTKLVNSGVKEPLHIFSANVCKRRPINSSRAIVARNTNGEEVISLRGIGRTE